MNSPASGKKKRQKWCKPLSLNNISYTPVVELIHVTIASYKGGWEMSLFQMVICLAKNQEHYGKEDGEHRFGGVVSSL